MCPSFVLFIICICFVVARVYVVLCVGCFNLIFLCVAYRVCLLFVFRLACVAVSPPYVVCGVWSLCLFALVVFVVFVLLS